MNLILSVASEKNHPNERAQLEGEGLGASNGFDHQND
jgi:hypothetical protein